MDLSVIIVNWNSKKYLQKCLESIFLFSFDLDFEVIVVDNNSTDGSQNLVKQNFSKVKLIENKNNEGFAKGNNIGYQLATGKYILLLNQDTELLENSFKKMVDFMDQNSEVGVLGVKLLNFDLTLQPSCRRFPAFWDQFLIFIKFHNAFPNFSVIKKYYLLDFDYEKESAVDQVMGSCLLIRRSVIKQLNNQLLDPAYWFWFEEVDLCRRVKNLGYKVFYSPLTAIIHHKGVSQKVMLKRQKIFIQSSLTYFKKFQPRWQYYALLILSPFSLFLSLLLKIVLKFFPLKKKKYL